MTNRITGMHFDTMIGDLLVHVEEASLDIDDSSTANKTKGVSDGWLQGSVSAGGELKVDTNNFNKIVESAKKAGSWRALKPFDMGFTADSGDEELAIEAFGCRLKISSLLSFKTDGAEKSLHTIPYEVTSPDFIHVNGVPYLDPEEIKSLT